MSQEAEDLFNEILNSSHVRRNKESTMHIWDNFIRLGAVQKSKALKVVVEAATRSGIRYILLTEFFLSKENEWYPKRGGIAVPICTSIERDGILCEPADALLDLIKEAVECAKTMELYDEERKVDVPRKPRKKAGANVGNYTPKQLNGFIEKYKTEYEFLDKLHDSGETNMWGATPYIAMEYGVAESEATHILFTWMATYEMRHAYEN